MQRKDRVNLLMRALLFVWSILGLLVACSKSTPIPESDYEQTDALIHAVLNNIANDAKLDEVLTIDHSRLANQQGSRLAPTRVTLFHNKALEAQLLQLNPLVAMELPIRVLAYQDLQHKQTKLVWNDFSYIAYRFNLQDQNSLAVQYQQSIQAAIKGIDKQVLSPLRLNRIDNEGLITLTSDMSFEDSLIRAVNIARDNKGVIIFDTIDYQHIAKEHGLTIPKLTLVLFGAPAPGGKAMKVSQSLGLDGFPQKLLVWNDSQGNTHITYNELLLLARRHQVPINTSLRIIQRRMDKAFKRSFYHE